MHQAAALFSWSSPSSALARALAYKYSSSLPLLSTQLGHRQNVLSRRARGERVPGRGRRRGAARGLPGWLAARGRLVRCGGRLGCGHFLVFLSLPTLSFVRLFQRAPAAAGFCDRRFPCSILSKPSTHRLIRIKIKDLTAR
jgi:hypothetical protein